MKEDNPPSAEAERDSREENGESFKRNKNERKIEKKLNRDILNAFFNVQFPCISWFQHQILALGTL